MKARLQKLHLILIALIALGFTTSCKKEQPLDSNIDKLGRATGPIDKRMGSHSNTPRAQKTHSGEVLETIDVPKYTYLRIDTGAAEELWVAVPTCEVKKGETVRVLESLVMKDFESPTLKRTFSSVVFGILDVTNNENKEAEPSDSKGESDEATALPPGHPPID